MSRAINAISSRFSVILGVGALLTWMVCVPTEVRADAGQGQKMSRGGHSGQMRDFAGHSLHRLLRHQKDLGLSAEQSAKIKATATDYAKTRIRGEADFKLAELEVRTLVRDEKADLAAIETALKKSESAHTALRLEGVKAMRAATAVLTPEQREKWRAGMMARHGQNSRSEMQSSDRESGGPMATPHELPKRES